MKRTLLASWPAFALGIYPLLRMYFESSDPISLAGFLRDFALIIVLTIGFLWLLKPFVPQLATRGLIVALFYLIFFRYHDIISPLNPAGGAETPVWRLLTNPASALALVGTVLLLLILAGRKWRGDPTTITITASIIAGVFLLFPLTEALFPLLTGERARALSAANSIVQDAMSQDLQPSGDLPDIYYVILDSYARSDVLEEVYGFHNGAFQEYLSDHGFLVPSQSRSNYPQTYLSLASSLNLSYLDRLSAVMEARSIDHIPLRHMVEDNAVARILKQVGYRFVFVSSYFPGTNDNHLADTRLCGWTWLGDSENRLIAWTPLSLLEPVQRLQQHTYRQGIECMLEALAQVAATPGPKFVFAHIPGLHPPFVFDSGGREVMPTGPLVMNDGDSFPGTRRQYSEGYVAQLTYLTSRLVKVVEAVLENSNGNPIIILQADHGSGAMLDWNDPESTNLKERLGIFTAYHVPAELRAQLPDTMTPVNTFRILFNALLGTAYALLPDRSYFATWNEPYVAIPVPSELLSTTTRWKP
jgi:hypothetical protein